MTQIHGLNPGHEHYACLVDLIGHAGGLDEARREVPEKFFELEPDNPGNYVLLSNMYKDNGRLEEADEIRRSMGINRIRKDHGCCWIDVDNKTFVFTVNDKSNLRMA
ncbi:Tetratricopeptide-like helical domain containing protein [Trema orientale]|uniref:Tetratricopeptide-like helical domain containing protein n=1 Tax=Trema orientale TaxID=63057 RepID=A0A2P5DRB7_TREOI|nr:Tetratricopeptide-like helical domain containing protein [Trema orientale]